MKVRQHHKGTSQSQLTSTDGLESLVPGPDELVEGEDPCCECHDAGDHTEGERVALVVPVRSEQDEGDQHEDN